MTNGKPFLRVNSTRRCPVCCKPDWCMVGDAACLCARVESERRCGEAGWLHKLTEKKPVTPPKPKRESSHWLALAERNAASANPKSRVNLARHLGLPDTAMDCFPLLGVAEDDGGKHFTFPEFDGEGRVVGLCRRYPDGKKFQVPDGGRGLSIPAGFDPRAVRVVFAVEGPTDTAGMVAAGLPAVGRPSNSGGAGDLGCLLQHCPADCRIVVVGENDKKANHDWPGLHGAAIVADQLAHILRRRPGSERHPVMWALCPDGAKDVREWLRQRVKPGDGQEKWHRQGEVLADKLLADAVPAEPVERSVRKLLTGYTDLRREMDEIKAQMAQILRK